jgi:hypothetical protein
MTHFETSMKDRLAVKAAEIRRNRALWQLAETLCIDLGITSSLTTLVPYIGNGQERSNLEAIKNWLDCKYENMLSEFGPLSVRQISDFLTLVLARNLPSHFLGE